MVSNDDIHFVERLHALEDIGIKMDASVASGVHTFTVPTNEKWVIHYIRANRGVSGAMAIYLKDIASNDFGLVTDTGVDLEFIPYTRFALRAGWAIVITYGSAGAGLLYSQILYEKEVNY